ncbi:MAG: mechanosensitive ion channel [Candidatus Eisenbacteria bacterium]|nr:mechanosensitive ion channel [Candidatus Eisenbacteria bacterium]
MNLSDKLAGIREFLNVPILRVSGTEITLFTLILALVILVAGYWLARALERAVIRLFRARGVTDEGTAAIPARLVHYLTLLLGFGLALNALGVNLTALFAAGALFAVGIGFALQNVMENFVSGIILLLERVIKPGDVVELENRIVQVVRMGIRSTVARTLDDEDLIVPNGLLVRSTVKNLTLRDNLHRLRCSVGVTYGSDMALVEKTLTRAAESVPWRIQDRPVRVLLRRFGDSSVEFEVSVWIDDPWKRQQQRSELNHAVWNALREAGITIAFPQMDVHFDEEVVRSIGAARTG